MAVLPLPNTSYEAPILGSHCFQQGRHATADLALPEAVPSQSKGELHVLLDGQLFEEPQPLGDDGQIGPRALTPGRPRYSGAG